MKTPRLCFLPQVFVLIGLSVWPAALAEDAPTKDIVFAEVDDHELKLDLFLPEGVEDPPLVVFIHGGGWRNNSYKKCLTPWLTEYGFAVASVRQLTFAEDGDTVIVTAGQHQKAGGTDSIRVITLDD